LRTGKQNFCPNGRPQEVPDTQNSQQLGKRQKTTSRHRNVSLTMCCWFINNSN